MQLSMSYDYLTRHIVPGPQSLTWFIPLLVLPIALLIPRTVLSRWQSIAIFMPIITLSAIHAWICMGGSDVISTNTPLVAAFLLALNDPWRDFRRLRAVDGKEVSSARGEPRGSSDGNGDVGREGEETTLLEPPSTEESTATAKPKPFPESYIEQPYPADIWSRLRWVGTLLVSIRLHHWKVGIPSHDLTQPPAPAFNNRKAFLLHALRGTLLGFLLLDLTTVYIHSDAFFTSPSLSTSSTLPFKPHTSGFLAHGFRTLVIAAQGYAIIGQIPHLPAASPVLLNALGLIPDEWSPHTWPVYFGSPTIFLRHGIRGWWGKFWHQTMRWSVSAPGMAVADGMGLKPRGLARATVVTVVAFGLSGAVHMGLVPPEPLFAEMSPGSIRLWVGGFFWLQPVGMVLEAVIARVMIRRTGRERWQSGSGLAVRMGANAVWLFFWGCICAPCLMVAGKQLGWWHVWPLPVSVWRGLTGCGWITWPFLKSD